MTILYDVKLILLLMSMISFTNHVVDCVSHVWRPFSNGERFGDRFGSGQTYHNDLLLNHRFKPGPRPAPLRQDQKLPSTTQVSVAEDYDEPEGPPKTILGSVIGLDSLLSGLNGGIDVNGDFDLSRYDIEGILGPLGPLLDPGLLPLGRIFGPIVQVVQSLDGPFKEGLKALGPVLGPIEGVAGPLLEPLVDPARKGLIQPLADNLGPARLLAEDTLMTLLNQIVQVAGGDPVLKSEIEDRVRGRKPKNIPNAARGVSFFSRRAPAGGATGDHV